MQRVTLLLWQWQMISGQCLTVTDDQWYKWQMNSKDRWTVNSCVCVQDKGRPGTVTAVPSRLAAKRAVGPQGFVDLRWDAGGEGCYRMGDSSQYELDLVWKSFVLHSAVWNRTTVIVILCDNKLCACQNCSQWLPAEKTGRGSLLNCPSCFHDDQIGHGTELNWIVRCKRGLSSSSSDLTVI